MNLTKFLKGSAILLLFSSFVISCHDNDVIEKEEDNQDPDTEESINLALGKTVETRINSITGSGSNTEKAKFNDCFFFYIIPGYNTYYFIFFFSKIEAIRITSTFINPMHYYF